MPGTEQRWISLAGRSWDAATLEGARQVEDEWDAVKTSLAGRRADAALTSQAHVTAQLNDLGGLA